MPTANSSKFSSRFSKQSKNCANATQLAARQLTHQNSKLAAQAFSLSKPISHILCQPKITQNIKHYKALF
jgi:hypothetical protein